jgi:hypothetical protein
VVAEEAVVVEVVVEAEEVVEGHQLVQIQPSNQSHKSLMSEQWESNPRTSLGIGKKWMISLKKYKAIYA